MHCSTCSYQLYHLSLTIVEPTLIEQLPAAVNVSDNVDEMLEFQGRRHSEMPINNWGFFRSVAACNDQKSWLSENPQVLVLIIL